ncbi:hypothetical protein IMG5_149750 [Ichthyophthirius multifiliis]|uniref:Transmembrane protein n=1 Tax=Ichthyophthirius multifiliis TaxID=5932 RepID=G0QYI0_ICHMU|nr:hypothetical protein IMG5_149750 [Ichthyophthirius multifiliis]EGR29732.1 hypothetical protein IMG5_149750 [Ichthyophthirius multifiliis]|eukprot:XP_004030968.1 hypothetical protein IMG5_149750 [Ichthyophthirius multifiliis]
MKGLNTKPVVLQGHNAKTGAIYIGVYGFANTIYSIVTEVERVDKLKIIHLVGGVYFQGHISRKNPIQYFVYNPINDSDDKQKGETNDDIEFNFKGQKDKLIILVNNDGTYPYSDGENGFQWQSSNGYLFISRKDKQYDKKASYQIAVMATEHAFKVSPYQNENIKEQLDLNFQLMASSSNVVKALDLGNTINDYLVEQGMKYYQIRIHNMTEVVYVSHYVKNQRVKNSKYFTFGVGSEPFEQIDKYEMKVQSNYTNFRLDPQFVKEKICKQKIQDCDIYLSISSNVDQEINYTLTVWAQEYAIELTEGVSHRGDFNNVLEYMNFYYIPNNKEHSLSIYLSSIYGHSSFNVLLWDNENSNNVMEWPFPIQSDDKYHFNSGIHNSHSISFSGEAFEFCWPDCILLISVSYYTGLPNDGEEIVQKIKDERKNDHFNIVVSSLYQDFHINQQAEFTIEQNEQKFFFLALNNILEENDSIIIEMTPLSGDGVLGVILKDDITNRYPNSIINEQTADIVSYANYLEISNKQLRKIMAKYDLKINQNPVLIIEVGCISDSAGKFVLIAMQGKNPVLDLMHGLPQEIFVYSNYKRYFKYFHFSDSDFTVKLQREIGYADLGIRVCKNAKNSKITSFEKCLKNTNEQTIQYTAGESFSNIHVSQDNEELYCQECLYIISVSAHEGETHAFISVIFQQDFTWLQESRQIRDFVEVNTLNLYRISVDQDEVTDLSVQSFNGSVEVYYSYEYTFDLKEFKYGPFSSENGGNTYLDTFKVKKGAVFIAIQNGDEESMYKLKPEFHKTQKTISKQKLKAGNQGKINYKRELGGNTVITFKSIVCEKCDKAITKGSKVNYEVIYSIDKEILNTIGKCQVRNYYEHDAQDNLHQVHKISPKNVYGEDYKFKTFILENKEQDEMNFSFKLDDDTTIYHLSIVAKIQNFENDPISIFYENIEIAEPNVSYKTEASVYAFIFACILVIIFFCMTTYLFWRRYKAMKKGLQANIRWRELELKQQNKQQQTKGGYQQFQDDYF